MAAAQLDKVDAALHQQAASDRLHQPVNQAETPKNRPTDPAIKSWTWSGVLQ